jgi:hypothetical protein
MKKKKAHLLWSQQRLLGPGIKDFFLRLVGLFQTEALALLVMYLF